jgi:hypothetical protein
MRKTVKGRRHSGIAVNRHGQPRGGASDRETFVSVRSDGSDRQVHALFSWATQATVSPDLTQVAYEEGDRDGLVGPEEVDRDWHTVALWFVKLFLW